MASPPGSRLVTFSIAGSRVMHFLGVSQGLLAGGLGFTGSG